MLVPSIVFSAVGLVCQAEVMDEPGAKMLTHSVVGEVGAAVGRVGGADGDRTVSGGRGGQACVAVVIAGCDDDGDTLRLGSIDRSVHGRAIAAAQAHGCD